MGMFVIYQKPTEKEIKNAIKGVTGWFKENPKRRVCNFEFNKVFKVRRNFIEEDIRKQFN